MAFIDDFTGAQYAQLGVRSGWSLASGSNSACRITASNQLEIFAGQGESLFFCTDQGSGDCYAQADWYETGNSSRPFMVIRATDANNYIGARAYSTPNTNEGNLWQLYKREGGTFTNLGEFAQTFVSGDTLRIEATGSDIKLSVNSIELVTATDSFNSTVTNIGLHARDTAINSWIDNFEAGAAVTGPTVTVDDIDTDNDVMPGQTATITLTVG